MTATGLADRLRGALWGRLVGDAAALGSHWIYDLDEQRRQFPNGVNGFESPAAGHYHEGKASGDQTHYGDGALVLIASVAQQGRFDHRAFGADFLGGFHPDIYPGYIDRATRGTFDNYQAYLAEHPDGDFDYQRGADDDHGATVTRLAAVVVRHLFDSDLAGQVERLTRVTQNNDTTVAYATTDALVMEGLLDGLGVEAAVDAALLEVAARWPAAIAEIRDGVAGAREMVDVDPLKVAEHFGQACPLPQSFPAAVHILLQHPDDFEQAVLAALRAGGDNAQRAAIVGGWVGARVGLSGIPRAWQRRLTAAPLITPAIDAIVAAVYSHPREQ
jgi:ADP-ribosyl-[dinitrogen reductase] hydrolase